MEPFGPRAESLRKAESSYTLRRTWQRRAGGHVGVSPGVTDVEIKLLLSIFAVQERPAGPRRGCFLITEEERRWEISQQTSSTVWLTWWVPIRKDPSPETDFSYLVWPNRRGKISVLRLLLGETSLFYLEPYSEGWAAQFDWRRSSLFEDYTGTKTCMQALYREAVISIIVIFVSGWRAAYIHVKDNKDFMKQSFCCPSTQLNLSSLTNVTSGSEHWPPAGTAGVCARVQRSALTFGSQNRYRYICRI